MIALLLPLLAFPWVGPPARPEVGPRPERERSAGDSIKIADFRLTERDGRTVTRKDLSGKVWIASFVLTNCPDGRCIRVTNTVERLEKELAGRNDLRFVTFTIDQATTLPDWMKHDRDRWLILTGHESDVDGVMRSAYLRGPKSTADEHNQKLVLIDQTGRVRGWYDGVDEPVNPEGFFEQNLRKLKKQVDEVRAESRPFWMPRDFPAFNAILNAIAASLILGGWLAIRARLTRLHVGFMVAALIVSALFLASYLYYHIVIKQGVSTSFREQAPEAPQWVALVYYAILLSHVILAMVATPMALIVAYFGLRKWWPIHVRLARWAMPIWLYVSVTGVVVYWMLYRLFPPA